MSFKLSRRSLDRLEGIDDRLQAVVKMAITMTKTDFGVVQGMRTLEQQKELVDKGASQTMKSKHLEGKAFDIMAYINGRASWELSVYDDLADAVKEAAIQLGVPICWGRCLGHTRHAIPNGYPQMGRHNGRSNECVYRFTQIAGAASFYRRTAL